MWDGTVLIAFYGKEPGVVIAMLRPLETTSPYEGEVTLPYIHPGKGPWSPETGDGCGSMRQPVALTFLMVPTIRGWKP